MAVSGDGTTVVSGATHDDVDGTTDQGSATVFVLDGGTWSEQATLTQSTGHASAYFGVSAAISEDGNTVAVGAYMDRQDSDATGAVTVFTRSGSTWTEQAILYKSDPENGDQFGESVALSADGNTVIVGAKNADPGGTDRQGSATVFTWSGSA